MDPSTSSLPPAESPSWSARLAPFKGPDWKRSVWQLASTATAFAGTWALMVWSLRVSYWWTLALAVPATFFLVRLFIIQHDCGHGSFFRSQRAAGIVGSILGVLTLTPYHYWKRSHAIHHATSGNLDRRGMGDIHTLTVEEYRALGRWGRLSYRVYRNPFFLFGIGGLLQFLVKHRSPTIVPRDWVRERRSILWTDLAIVALVVGMGLLVGFQELLLVQIPLTILSCSMGVWLFYVQHQFESSYWERDGRWTYEDAALRGSSYYALPQPLQWLTGNIGLHHIHHLQAGIPNYRLEKALRAYPELERVSRVTLGESLRCMSLALWDEGNRRLVGFPR